jgi:hypothetical protein
MVPVGNAMTGNGALTSRLTFVLEVVVAVLFDARPRFLDADTRFFAINGYSLSSHSA